MTRTEAIRLLWVGAATGRSTSTALGAPTPPIARPATPRPAWRARGPGKEARLCYAGHLLGENRHGLLVGAELTRASGSAERETGLRLLARQRRRSGRRRLTVAADRGYDTADFVSVVRALQITPNVAARRRGSAIDGRTARHDGYAISLRRRTMIEEAYGWMKVIGGLRKLRHRGQAKVAALFTFAAAAYNLVRLRRLLAEPSPG